MKSEKIEPLCERRNPSRKPNFTFVRDALHPGGITINREPGDTFLKFNFDLCRALDMTSMSIVLGKMVEHGWLDCREAELFHLQASSLLAQLRTANNRAYAIATEARRAGTGNTDPVHEGAGLKGIAQNQDPSPFKSEGN